MFYELLYPLRHTFSVFNVFRYTSFRTICAIISALLICFLVAPYFIKKLKQLQIGETIYKFGPKTHYVKKGTPTMGGLLVLFSLLLPSLLWADIRSESVWIILIATTLFGAIGLLDDYLKLKKRKHGLSVWEKFGLQTAAALMIVGYLFFFSPMYKPFVSEVWVPFFKDARPDIGFWYIPFAVFVIVGTSDAVNLTDGLDGLAIGPIIIATAAYMVIAYLSGHFSFAKYLNIRFVRDASELVVFCGAVIGACLGFLWYNSYPAEIFLGNVGSTAIGGMLGTIAIMTKHELILPLIGGVFVIEALSVIIQVFLFRVRGKRVFKMAPLHHHFEESGWREPKVIVRFWIIAIVFALVSLSTLKLR
ncbi:MAG: phospho-N-acetylmuramoyl-pentapeptide-transferase [Nitrospinota bacterium]